MKAKWMKRNCLMMLLTGLVALNLPAQNKPNNPQMWWTPLLFPKGGEDLKQKLGDLELVGDWIYDDIEAGFRKAKAERKPLLVVFRCVT